MGWWTRSRRNKSGEIRILTETASAICSCISLGNLNHFHKGADRRTGAYVRNRPLEFSDDSKRPKEIVLADFDAAIAMVASTIRKQSPEDWVAPYSDPAQTHCHDRFSVFMRMAAHAFHHVGQIIYLSKELTKSP